MIVAVPFFKLFSLYHGGREDFAVGADERMPEQKICIDLHGIDTIQQHGRWRVVPEPGPQPPPPDVAFIDMDEPPGGLIARPRRRANVPPPPRRREMFFIDHDRFILQMKNGNSWTVSGSFDEFVEILTKFQSSKETV